MTTRARGVWEAAATSQTGSSHARTGRPNQDAWALDNGRSWLVATVSDGHGGSRYVRSDVGAALAVRLAVETVQGLMGGRDPLPSEAVRNLPVALVPRWREAVLEHHGQHPLSAQESAIVGDQVADPTILYGATLIVAVLRGDQVAVSQIGDGSALAVTGGRVLHPVPGDSRLVANETTSLCLPTAVTDFRWGQVRLASPDDMVLLATDGYGNSFASDTWETEVMTDLETQVREHGFADVVRASPSWASESAEVGGDDVTLVLAHRRPAPQVAAARGSAARGSTLAGLATLALGTLAAGAFLATRPDDPPPVGVTSTTTSNVTTSTSQATTDRVRTRTTRSGPATVTQVPGEGTTGTAGTAGTEGRGAPAAPDSAPSGAAPPDEEDSS